MVLKATNSADVSTYITVLKNEKIKQHQISSIKLIFLLKIQNMQSLCFTGTRENSQKYVKIFEDNNPLIGDISILFFTDYKFGEIKHLHKTEHSSKLSEKKPKTIYIILKLNKKNELLYKKIISFS